MQDTPPPPQPKHLPPNPEAKAWLAKYRSRSKTFARIFLVLVVVGIGIAIRVGIGEFNGEWAASTAFAACVTFAFAFFSRRKQESSWAGVVSKRNISETRRNSNEYDDSVIRHYQVFFDTNRGKKKLKLTPFIYANLPEGTKVQKLPGFNVPLPTAPDFPAPYCPICGKEYNEATDRCKSCRSPIMTLSDLV